MWKNSIFSLRSQESGAESAHQDSHSQQLTTSNSGAIYRRLRLGFVSSSITGEAENVLGACSTFDLSFLCSLKLWNKVPKWLNQQVHLKIPAGEWQHPSRWCFPCGQTNQHRANMNSSKKERNISCHSKPLYEIIGLHYCRDQVWVLAAGNIVPGHLGTYHRWPQLKRHRTVYFAAVNVNN